jgi:hypothetical protein
MRQRVRYEPDLRMPPLVLRNAWHKSDEEYESGRDDRESRGLIRVAVLRGHEEESR